MCTGFRYLLIPMLTGLRAYTERKPLEPKYPSLKPSVADFVVSTKDNASSVDNDAANTPSLEELDLSHGPPG